MARRAKPPVRPLRPREPVEIDGRVCARDDDAPGQVTKSVLHGIRGRVCSNNANYTNSEGVPMVGIRVGEHGAGGLLAVPRAALRRPASKSLVSIGATAWERIFGQSRKL